MEAILRNTNDLENCSIGTKVILIFSNGEDYTGIFKGMDGEETIMLQALESETTIGLPLNRLSSYLEETEEG